MEVILCLLCGSGAGQITTSTIAAAVNYVPLNQRRLHVAQSDSEVISNRSAEIPAITHSVVFKCIGSTKESSYQDALVLAKSKMRLGQSVPVRLKNEPNNPKDSRAIAFECKPADQYIRIVHEALDAVHNAIDQDKIVRVSFDYVKFVVQFKARGWYAGIIITRQGEWPAHVLRCRAKSFIS